MTVLNTFQSLVCRRLLQLTVGTNIDAVTGFATACGANETIMKIFCTCAARRLPSCLHFRITAMQWRSFAGRAEAWSSCYPLLVTLMGNRKWLGRAYVWIMRNWKRLLRSNDLSGFCALSEQLHENILATLLLRHVSGQSRDLCPILSFWLHICLGVVCSSSDML